MIACSNGPRRRTIAARAVALLDADPARVWSTDELRRALDVHQSQWPSTAAHICQSQSKRVRYVASGRTFQSRLAPVVRAVPAQPARDIATLVRVVVERLQAEPDRSHKARRGAESDLPVGAVSAPVDHRCGPCGECHGEGQVEDLDAPPCSWCEDEGCGVCEAGPAMKVCPVCEGRKTAAWSWQIDDDAACDVCGTEAPLCWWGEDWNDPDGRYICLACAKAEHARHGAAGCDAPGWAP